MASNGGIGNRFTENQIEILQKFYGKGMNGTGQRFTSTILAASKETSHQVKVSPKCDLYLMHQ